MSALDEEVLKCALRKVLDERKGVDEKTHRTHHDYVARLIERDCWRKKRWEKVSVHVLGWGALAFVIWLVSVIGEGLLNWLANLLKTKGP